MYLANKITNPDTQESCYPDLIFKVKDENNSGREYEERELTDANAYRDFCAALNDCKKEYLFVLFDEKGYEIRSIELSQLDRNQEEGKWLRRLSEEMNCSETMEIGLKTLIHYICNKSSDIEESMSDLVSRIGKEVDMPCKDRNTGKKALAALTAMAINLEATDKNSDLSERDTLEYYKPFSHVYVEKEIKDNPEAVRILSEFKNSEIIEINDCKDVFFRKNQNVMLQHKSRQLVIATQHAQMLYPGAPVCQSFGNEHFYYTSCVKNCIFDCEYCYLKGMYPSGNVVVYADLDRIFNEVREKLKEHSMYICISYDTDLLALEDKLHFVERWIDFCMDNPDLRIEVRTKSANKKAFDRLKKCDRAIFAFTLSPEEVVSAHEKNTPSLSARIACIKYAMENGYKVRLCFDPMIFVPGWEEVYGRMLREVSSVIDMTGIMDVSVGGFRISSSYLKKMRKVDDSSEIVWFPYDNIDGYYQYSKNIQEEMIGNFTSWLGEIIDKNKIFL